MRHTVLEVPKPAFQCEIQIRADGSYTSSIAASGLAPYGVFEFIQALLARPFLSLFKMVAKEVEPSSLAGINDPCFSRVQFQSVFFYPVVDLFQRLLRFLLLAHRTTKSSAYLTASGCSPPRLSTTQFPSATDRPVFPSGRDFHPSVGAYFQAHLSDGVNASITNTQNISPKIAQNNFPNHSKSLNLGIW